MWLRSAKDNKISLTMMEIILMMEMKATMMTTMKVIKIKKLLIAAKHLVLEKEVRTLLSLAQ